jgi:hypothetical protein
VTDTGPAFSTSNSRAGAEVIDRASVDDAGEFAVAAPAVNEARDRAALRDGDFVETIFHCVAADGRGG